MIKKYIKYILCLTIFAGSCNVLDHEPITQLAPEQVFTEFSGAEAALLAGYANLAGQTNNLLIYGDVRSDVVSDEFGWIQWQSLRNNVITPQDGIVNWNAFYTGLHRINDVIFRVPNIQHPSMNSNGTGTNLEDNTAVSRRDQLLGEALFLRAINYFYMTRIWGNVPLIKLPSNSVDQNAYPSRTATATVMDSIEEDLIEAIRLLPDRYNDNLETRGRATRGAAKAILAQLYMWQGANNDALPLLNEIINTPVYNLASEFSQLFIATPSGAGGKNISNELIFELQFDHRNLATNNLSNLLLPTTESLPDNERPGGQHQLVPSEKLFLSYEDNDTRKDVTLRTTALPGGYWAAKYQGTRVDNTRRQDSNFPIIRLADIYLLRAEALVKLGREGDAINDLNRVRRRAYSVPLNQTSPHDYPSDWDDDQGINNVALAIENERLKELAFEGHRYFDLVRNDRLAAVADISEPILLPVSERQIELNPNLAPNNPGYQ